MWKCNSYLIEMLNLRSLTSLRQPPLAVVPRLRYRSVQPLPQRTPKKKFKTVRANRTTSRTSTPRGLTGERPPVAKTVTSVGTPRSTISNIQNLCQSTSLGCMRKVHQCFLLGADLRAAQTKLPLASLGDEKARLRCFGPMFKRAVVTGYSSSLVTKGAVSAQRNSQPRPSLRSDIKVQEFAKPRFATCAVRVLAVLQFWGSCPACPPSARSRSLGSRIGQFFTSGGGHEILLSSV